MTKVYSKIFKNRIEWYKEGMDSSHKEGTDNYHREDGPAVEWIDGTKWWFQNGLVHRIDGPAEEFADGRKSYWLNGRYYPDIKTDEEWIIFQIIN